MSHASIDLSIVPPRHIETPLTPARPASPKVILSGMWSNTPPDETSGEKAIGTDRVEDAASSNASPPPKTGKRGPVGALFEQPSGTRLNDSEESPAEEPPVTAGGLPDQVAPKKGKPDLLGGAFLSGEEECS
jgi:hypothetical protein